MKLKMLALVLLCTIMSCDSVDKEAESPYNYVIEYPSGRTDSVIGFKESSVCSEYIITRKDTTETIKEGKWKVKCIKK
jgi:hypothetical protein